MPRPQEDLNALADQAAQTVERQHAQASAAAQSAQAALQKRGRLKWGWLMWAAALVLWGWQLRGPLMHDSQSRADLAALMEQARTEVDAAVKSQGRLPDALSSPALASIVKYEVMDAASNPPAYRLEGRLGEVSQTWSSR